MPTSLALEIQQTRPFATLEEEAFVSIARAAAVLGHALGEAFKPYGITSTQYNVLRILRGAGREGRCRNEIRDRLVAQVPDVTRLLDRMQAAGLVSRSRNTDDRRQVTTRISATGLELLAQLHEPVAALQRDSLGHMDAAGLRTLIDLLALARTRGS